MGRIADFLLDALFPRTCVHCQQKGQLLCVSCRAANALGEVPAWTADHVSCAWYAVPAVRRLIDAWKFHGDLQAEEALRERLMACAQELRVWVGEGAVLVPTPLTRRRFAERGFNQAERLARHLGEVVRLPVQKSVVRQGKNVHLAQLSTAGERRRALMSQHMNIQGNVPRDIILVDDVRTTGETLRALSELLRRHGAERIRTFTFALSRAPSS